MKIITNCPICGEADFSPLLSARDYTVSHETFNIAKCRQCNLAFTNPQPEFADLPKYYESDDYISHSGKSSGIINTAYMLARSFTLTWKCNIVEKNIAQGKKMILDYGCGTGDFLKKCKTKNFSIAGVEPSPLARAKATSNTGENIASQLSNFSDQRFAAITLWHVLEHVPDLSETVSSLVERLEQNGILFIAVPNRLCDDAEYYKTYWAGYDVPRHLWHFSPESMKLLLENKGLKIKSILPMKLDAYYVSLLSEKYIHGSQTFSGMIRATVRGMKSNYQARRSGNYSSLIYIATR